MNAKEANKIGLILIYIGIITALVINNLSFIPVEAVNVAGEVSDFLILIGVSINTGALSGITEKLTQADTPNYEAVQEIKNEYINANSKMENKTNINANNISGNGGQASKVNKDNMEVKGNYVKY